MLGARGTCGVSSRWFAILGFRQQALRLFFSHLSALMNDIASATATAAAAPAATAAAV